MVYAYYRISKNKKGKYFKNTHINDRKNKNLSF